MRAGTKNRILKNAAVRLNERSGQSLVFMIVAMVFFIGICGFAVDVGILYLKRAELRRALDAGAVAGMTQLASGSSNDDAKAAAKEIALYNLHESDLTDEDILDFPDPVVTKDASGLKLSMEARIRGKTLFARMIPGLGFDTVPISTDSIAGRRKAVISLVLDRSGSMNFNGGAPIANLRTAAKAFVKTFQTNLDEIAIVVFNTHAQVLRPMGTFATHAELTTLIDTIVATNSTNIGQAVVLGRREIEKVPSNVDVERAMVLFSDGSPNTITVPFLNPREVRAPLQPLPIFPPGSGRRTYTVYEQVQPTSEMAFAGTQPGASASAAIPCSTRNRRDVSDCLDDFTYLDSRGKVRGAEIANINLGSLELMKEFFDLPIIESDYAKSDKTTVYSIGLGNVLPVTADPYQNAWDDDNLKPVLLRRIANAAQAGDPAFTEVPNNPAHPRGMYLETPEENQLSELFLEIAKKIQLRLIK